MARLSRRLDQVVLGLTLAAGWVVILTLIPLMLFHVLGRQVQDVIVCVAAFPRVAVWLPAQTLDLGAPQTVKGIYGLGGRK